MLLAGGAPERAAGIGAGILLSGVRKRQCRRDGGWSKTERMCELNRKPVLAAALAALAALAACAPTQPNAHLTRLNIATRFGPNNVCSEGVLPAIAVRGAPAGTALYRVRISSMDVLYQRPWEGTVATAGGDIEEGAAPGFPAPCLSEQQELLYRFEVMALDSASRPLAYGQTGVMARPPARTTAPATPPAGGPAAGTAPTGVGARPPEPQSFDRAAGVQGGPYVLRELTPAQSTVAPAVPTRDSLNQLGGRITRPPPVQSAPVVE
jgi:hypothetical protein